MTTLMQVHHDIMEFRRQFGQTPKALCLEVSDWAAVLDELFIGSSNPNTPDLSQVRVGSAVLLPCWNGSVLTVEQALTMLVELSGASHRGYHEVQFGPYKYAATIRRAGAAWNTNPEP